MNDVHIAPASPRGHRVRELVYAYRSLRGSDGRVVDVPSVALNTPRNAAAVLAPLIADQPVEVFGVACLSTRYRLLAWHLLSRGTRVSTPVSMPDVFLPACLTPGTTGLMVVHNHPSGVMRTSGFCGVGGISLAGGLDRACSDRKAPSDRDPHNRGPRVATCRGGKERAHVQCSHTSQP